jgi:soluble lytic murein transglycosylase-like protein
MKGVYVRSARSTRFELFSARNVFLACSSLVLLALAARIATGEALPGLGGGLTAQGQISYAPMGDEPKAVHEMPRGLAALSPGELRVAKFIHQQYQIANEAAEEITTVAADVGKTVGLDPMLLLAVMAIESRFNPIAESQTGAKGLMQIIPQFHLQKVSQLGAGTDDVLQPWINVLVGAQILREYVTRAGSLDGGLQWYNGASNDETKSYASRVLAERDRFVRESRARSNGKT